MPNRRPNGRRGSSEVRAEGEERVPCTRGLGGGMLAPQPWGFLNTSTEISTAGVVPVFWIQCVVVLSSGQPTP